MAVDLSYNYKYSTNNLYLITLGSPRVGDTTFAQYAHTALQGHSLRLVHALDIVPHVPLEPMGYSHIPAEVWESAPGVFHISPLDMFEDPQGADSVSLQAKSISDHLNYLGIPLVTCPSSSPN
jgi:hypothetical protein